MLDNIIQKYIDRLAQANHDKIILELENEELLNENQELQKLIEELKSKDTEDQTLTKEVEDE